MPELPEVEAVRRGLAHLVVGKTVQGIRTNWPAIVYDNVQGLEDALIGARLNAVQRRGKYLLLGFDNGETLVSHLRMEGKYALVDAQAPEDKHDHVFFRFSDGTELRYNDVRKFGRMQLIDTAHALELPSLQKLGPEPLTPEFTVAGFRAALKGQKAPIKAVLLGQKAVVGIGNIYADETLWRAKIHPLQPAGTLNPAEISRLHAAIVAVLEAAIAAGGTSVWTYKNAEGHAGNFQDQLKVYGRAGQPCERCGTTIEKIRVAQRGTCFCPHDQKLRRRKLR